MTKARLMFDLEVDEVLPFVRDRLLIESKKVCDISNQISYAVEALEQTMDQQGDVRHTLIYLDNVREDMSRSYERLGEYIKIVNDLVQPVTVEKVSDELSEIQKVFRGIPEILEGEDASRQFKVSEHDLTVT